jgi:hypothetical protein
MYAAVPAIAYRASWCDFFTSELTPHLFFNFFTSSCPAFPSRFQMIANTITSASTPRAVK